MPSPSLRPLPAFAGLVGSSAPMRALVARLQRVAPVEVPVLIFGESGTGKELVATALHQLSRRRAARFEAVNCAALTRDLLRSELFGHERGAFTGAVERRAGLLPLADGGTVFLDEVGELAPDAQAILLRFLADGEVRPVGGDRARHVDVRIVAATHRDLPEAIAAGRFREDLYYRLRRVVLPVPPLRDRLVDLPLLVEHLRRQGNARHGLAIAGVTAAALAGLRAHPWPGNVRELDAILEEAMILKGEGWLEPADLALPGNAGRPRAAATPAAATASGGRRAAALELAATHGAVTRRQLAAACHMSGELARQELVALVRLEQLRRVGRGRATRYVRP